MKKLSKLLIFLLVFSSFFPLAASIRNLDSAQKTHIGVFEEISPDLHLAQNPYLTETQQGCNDFFQYDAHRPLYVWYFRARYFSDELGRFISRDPLGYVDGYGLYNGYFASHFQLDPTGMIEKSHYHYWTSKLTRFEDWITGNSTAAYQHYLNVFGQSNDGCKLISHGADNALGQWTYAVGPPDYDVSIAKPVPGTKKVDECECEDEEVECITYTSNYVAYIGIKTKLLDISADVASSTISITICANGDTDIAYERRWP
ncbi:MAG: hypothetical protein MK132_23620 [Lentisphaerales bacterium]|nr:hypothetical protein [Lentisphaerales bacterium]